MQLDRHADNHLKSLLQLAQHWQQLDRRIKQLLPPQLHPYMQVIHIRDGVLVIHAATSMAAGRLNMLLPPMLPELQTVEGSICSIKIKVRPVVPQNKPPKNFHIGSRALDCFEATAERLNHHPELAEAMRRLAKNNR